jgi:allantoin racemase
LTRAGTRNRKGRIVVRIRVVAPVVSREFEAMTLEALSPAARPDTDISVVSLDKGPPCIESSYDKALAVPDTVAKIMQAEKDGVAAVVCSCYCDAGVEEAREVVSIPVVGAGETSMHIAAMLGHRFSVITTLDRRIPLVESLAAKAGVAAKLVSVRPVNMRVPQIVDDRARVVKTVVDEFIGAVQEDGAHVLILGCTGMAGLAKTMEDSLRKQGIPGVPVIDPAILALKVAEALADIGLSHSKRSYPIPPAKEIVGY